MDKLKLQYQLNPWTTARTKGILGFSTRCQDEVRKMKEMENFANLGLMIWKKYISQDPWDNLEIDGGDLQEILVECGLLRKETRTTPCGEICSCAEYHGMGETVECYVKCYDKGK